MDNKQGKKLSKRQALRAERARQAKRQRIMIIGGIFILVAAIIGLIVTSTSGVSSAGEFTRITPQPYQNENGLKLGDPNAKVVIDLFEDFKCSACQSYTASIEPRVIAELIDTGMASYVFHNYPFMYSEDSGYSDSTIAAHGAMCAAEQNRLWDFKKLIFVNLQYIVGEFSENKMIAFADSLNLDESQFKQCITERRYQKEIDADLALGLQMGVTGTPSIFVNGVNVKPGFVASFEEIKAAVEAALK